MMLDWKNVAATAAKAFASGLCARYVLAAIKRKSLTLADLLSEDVVRAASFLATFTSSYKLMRNALEVAGLQNLKFAVLSSSALASLALPLGCAADRHTLTVLALSRAIGSAIAGEDGGAIAPFLLYCLGFAFLSCIVLRWPTLMSRPFSKALLGYVNYSDAQMEGMFRGKQFVECESVLHRGSCLAFHVKNALLTTLPASLKLYSTIYAVPLILQLKKGQRPLGLYLRNVCQSSFFLTATCSAFALSLCLLRNCSQRSPTPLYVPAVSGLVASFGLLIESKSRRAEMIILVLHQVTHVILAWLMQEARKVKIHANLLQMIIFAVSAMRILYMFDGVRQRKGSLINKILAFLL
ncbi:uncharacterized protein [Oscarella lobularis]|uniref:uncharacterized protein n=1 Tax=Oscarella lobularis TaxID=121494 RepID=UPI003313BB42